MSIVGTSNVDSTYYVTLGSLCLLLSLAQLSIRRELQPCCTRKVDFFSGTTSEDFPAREHQNEATVSVNSLKGFVKWNYIPRKRI